MSALTKVSGTDIASRLRDALRAKYATGGLPATSALLLDISGSMGGWKIGELRKLAAEFAQARRFEFHSTCSEIPAGNEISDPGGGTAMHVAFLYVKSHGIDHVVLITDGEPDCQQQARAAAVGLKIDIFYVGPDLYPPFLKKLAEESGGTCEKGDLGAG